MGTLAYENESSEDGLLHKTSGDMLCKFCPHHPESNAITDIYDPSTGKLLFRHAVWIVGSLSCVGFLAFAYTGFSGYSDDPELAKVIEFGSTPLFVWLCILMITTHLIVLRHVSFRRKRIGLLLVGIIAVSLTWTEQHTHLGSTALLLLHLFISGNADFYTKIAPYLAAGFVAIWFFFFILPPLIKRVRTGSDQSIAEAIASGLLRPFQVSTRALLWPALLIVTVYSLWFVASSAYHYIHVQAALVNADSHAALLQGVEDFSVIIYNGILAGLGTAFVPSLIVFNWRLASNTLSALALLVNGIVQFLLPALILLNAVLWISGITMHTPFFQPSAGTLVASGIFVYLVIRGYLRYQRQAASTGVELPNSEPD